MYVHINWLKQEYMKTLRNWKEVNKKMNATMQIRRKMICDKTPLKDILRLFPFLRCPYQVTEVHVIMTLIYSIDVTQLWMFRDVWINTVLFNFFCISQELTMPCNSSRLLEVLWWYFIYFFPVLKRNEAMIPSNLQSFFFTYLTVIYCFQFWL